MPVSTISLGPDDIIVLQVTAPEAHRIFPREYSTTQSAPSKPS